MKIKKAQPISSTLARATKILEFISEKQPVTASEIHVALGVTKGSIYHVLSSLEMLDYVRKEKNAYYLTFKLYAMGQTVPMALDFIQVARPFMKKLAEKENLNVYLAVPDGLKMVGVSHIIPPGPIRVANDFALTYKLHCTASGKLWLSYLPKTRRESIYRQMCFEKVAENTITNPARLEREIEKIAAQGYSQELMEHSSLINGVAAPILDHENIFIASLSAIGPTPVLTPDQLGRVGLSIMQAAKEISLRLGSQSSPPND